MTDETKICPVCFLPYSFLRPRVSGNGKSWCLSCGVKQERVELAQRKSVDNVKTE